MVVIIVVIIVDKKFGSQTEGEWSAAAETTTILLPFLNVGRAEVWERR